MEQGHAGKLGLPWSVMYIYIYIYIFIIMVQVILNTHFIINSKEIDTGIYFRGKTLLSGVPDFFDRNKILSGGDLSHYQVRHCIRVFFLFCLICVYSSQFFNFILNYEPIVTFWIFTYHNIWILLIIFCFIWNYWIIHFLTCLEVFWSVVS